MDVYLRSQCCEFEFQKKRWQQPLKKNMLNNKVKLSFKNKSYSLLMFLFLYICFSIFDQIKCISFLNFRFYTGGNGTYI